MPSHPSLFIEHWLPIEAIGAESKRERGASSALPPLYFLHIWWARRPLLTSRAAILADEGLQQAAKANTLDNFAYVFDKALECFFIDRMKQNQDIFAKFMNDAEFKSTVAAYLRSQVYQQIRGGMGAGV